jgi:pyruvate dehydrogenase E2 component (dihydrolipoamide acetyltransferase)
MDVLMPQLGETVAEGTVANWYKQVGDDVTADEILLDVETDKVSMEIPAPKTGKITKILVQAGETVDVGTVLAVIEAEGDAASATSAETAPSSTQAEKLQASPGPESLASPTALAAQTLGENASGGGSQKSIAAAPAGRSDTKRLSPAVRRLVAEHELDVSAIQGSGRNGRVTRRNVVEFIAAGGSEPAMSAAPQAVVSSSAQASAAAASQPALSSERIPFSRIRRLTAEHMVMSKSTSPHVLQAVEVDFSGVERVRKAVKETWKAQRGYSLTFLPFIAHAVCIALREFPHANASVGDAELILHSHVNLAIAIDLGPGGLVAPVIKSAEKLSVTQIADSIYDLAARARSNRLKPDDLSGGTYTLSNSGTFGTLITAPIINQPQVAILSTDGVRKKPIVIEHPDGDSIAIRPVGILAQSFDHRAIDGAYSAAFLDRIRKLLEQTAWFREV